ncbi:hypothetical protein DERP_007157 [Dermatophagoides pteronyssinus]|uniref:Uncharacterized protein n=1 Tax=Dermatophagoides pteronyssinus TaxID=6956 RepID=A0ABQ8JUH5_DERPT|nr:hypothetical protein DERP_007157 [Dermatophagoides pteronyssinus]
MITRFSLNVCLKSSNCLRLNGSFGKSLTRSPQIIINFGLDQYNDDEQHRNGKEKAIMKI